MTTEFINPIISATKTVFETMLGCVPERSGLVLKESMEPRYEVSAVIGITGKVAGTMVLSLSQGAALQVLNGMLGIEADEVNADVCDAIGELTNMIAGQAKSKMEHLNASLSIPNIVSGKNHEIHYPSNVTPICVLFSSDIGPFAIEVGFSSNN
jgi:chemotaxis protein CheX